MPHNWPVKLPKLQPGPRRWQRSAVACSACLEGYLGGPEAASKPSSRDARNVLTNHILKAFPELMARKAADIGPADLRPVFARLIDAGKAAQLAATTRPRNVARDSATGSCTVVH